MFQPVPPYNDQVPPSTNHYRLPLTQYHRVPTSTALYWHSTIIYQPVPFYTDPVLQSTNQYRPILTQYHQVLTSTTFYWPSIKTSLFFFSSVKTIFPFSGYYPPFPPPFIVPSAKNIFLLHIFSSFFSFVDLRWAQLYVSLVLIYFEQIVSLIENFCSDAKSLQLFCEQSSLSQSLNYSIEMTIFIILIYVKEDDQLLHIKAYVQIFENVGPKQKFQASFQSPHLWRVRPEI